MEGERAHMATLLHVAGCTRSATSSSGDNICGQCEPDFFQSVKGRAELCAWKETSEISVLVRTVRTAHGMCCWDGLGLAISVSRGNVP